MLDLTKLFININNLFLTSIKMIGKHYIVDVCTKTHKFEGDPYKYKYIFEKKQTK